MENERRKLDSLLIELKHLKRIELEEEKILANNQSKVEDVANAQIIVQSVSQYCQEQAHKQISSVVTRCIQSVFGEDSYNFKIRFDSKRSKTEAVLVFEKDGMELDDPTESSGGGVLDIAALALRIASLSLARPRKRMFICADEPMKNINGEQFQENAAALIEALAEEMGIQFCLVTDDDWLKIGKVIEL